MVKIMKKIMFFLDIMIIMVLAVSVFAARQISGDVKKVDPNKRTITITNVSGDITIKVDSSASKLLRGMVGTNPPVVDILSIAPGDVISASINDKDIIITATALFKIEAGVIKQISGNTITTEDGKKFQIAPEATIHLANSQPGVIEQLKPGMTFYARTSPSTGYIWTFIVTSNSNSMTTTEISATDKPKTEPVVKPVVEKPKTEPVVKPVVEKPKTEPVVKPVVEKPKTEPVVKPVVEKPKTVPVVKPVAEKPKTVPVVKPVVKPTVDLSIDSVELSAPSDIKSNDLILVKVSGSERAGVTSDVKYVANTKVNLREDGLGNYMGFLKVPEKDLNKAKIVVYMSKAGKNISFETDYAISVNNKSAKIYYLPAVNVKPAVVAEPSVSAVTSPGTPVVNSVESVAIDPVTPADPTALETSVESVVPESPAAANTPVEVSVPVVSPVEPVATELVAPVSPAVTPVEPLVPAAPETPAVVAPVVVPNLDLNTPGLSNETNAVVTPSITPSDDKTGTTADITLPIASIPAEEKTPINPRAINVLSPSSNTSVKDILIAGYAIPNAQIAVKVMYTNNMSGILAINGVLKEDIITTKKDGGFSFGPVELKGFFASKNLLYYVILSYIDEKMADVSATELILTRE